MRIVVGSESEFAAGFDHAAKTDAAEFKRLDARITELEAQLERIKAILIEEDVLDQLSHSHTVYEATEDHGGVADDEIDEETLKRAADLEYVMNWLHPNYISPAFPDDWVAANREKLNLKATT